MTEDAKKIHLIYGGLLLLIALVTIIVYVVVRSQAANTSISSSASVNNSSPTVDTVYVTTTGSTTMSDSGTITPTENTTKTVYINGAFSDLNGCREVASSTYGGIHSMFYRSSGQTNNCVVYNSQCYSVATSTCIISGCDSTTDTSANYSCSLSLQYYANATDASAPIYPNTKWTAYVRATDSSIATGTNTNANTTIATLVAVNVPATISYGSLAVGAISGIQTSQFTNYGNGNENPTISGTAFTCTTGTLAVGQQTYSSSSVFATTNTLTTSAQATTLNLYPYDDGSVSAYPGTTNTYWRVSLPSAGGYAGTCSATVTVTAAQ